MNFELFPMTENDIPVFKKDIQEAFQKGFEVVYGTTDETVLPEKDIDQSLSAKGSVAIRRLLTVRSSAVLLL